MIDTHCHLDDPAFDDDRDDILQECRRRGITGIAVPGISAATWPRLFDVVARSSLLYPALGLHPIYSAEHTPEDIPRLAELIERTHPVAIGEIGLDYYVENADRERQQRFFAAQLDLARAAGLPVLLHVRRAHDETLAYLRRARPVGGIVHAFNGSLQQAQHYLDLGFKLGFGGAMTYERARKLRRLAVELPLESLVLETDAPDLSPSAHHGERNSPTYLPEILAVLAQLRAEDPAHIAAATSYNAQQVLGLKL